MPTVIAGASQTISIAVGEAYRVSIADGGDAYVDLLSGAPGAPYASPRLRAPKTSEVFGPYPSAAQIRVRSISGSTEYGEYSAPAPVIYDPTSQKLFAGAKDLGSVSGDGIVITPSGDSTGLLDTAAIQAVISQGNALVLAEDATYWTDDKITLQAGSTMRFGRGARIKRRNSFSAFLAITSGSLTATISGFGENVIRQYQCFTGPGLSRPCRIESVSGSTVTLSRPATQTGTVAVTVHPGHNILFAKDVGGINVYAPEGLGYLDGNLSASCQWINASHDAEGSGFRFEGCFDWFLDKIESVDNSYHGGFFTSTPESPGSLNIRIGYFGAENNGVRGLHGRAEGGAGHPGINDVEIDTLVLRRNGRLFLSHANMSDLSNGGCFLQVAGARRANVKCLRVSDDHGLAYQAWGNDAGAAGFDSENCIVQSLIAHNCGYGVNLGRGIKAHSFGAVHITSDRLASASGFGNNISTLSEISRPALEADWSELYMAVGTVSLPSAWTAAQVAKINAGDHITLDVSTGAMDEGLGVVSVDAAAKTVVAYAIIDPLGITTDQVAGLVTSSSPAGAGAITLNGAQTSAGASNYSGARKINITSAGNVSARSFTITGTAWDGSPYSEVVPGPNATTVQTRRLFLTVAAITIDGASASAITIGTCVPRPFTVTRSNQPGMWRATRGHGIELTNAVSIAQTGDIERIHFDSAMVEGVGGYSLVARSASVRATGIGYRDVTFGKLAMKESRFGYRLSHVRDMAFSLLSIDTVGRGFGTDTWPITEETNTRGTRVGVFTHRHDATKFTCQSEVVKVLSNSADYVCGPYKSDTAAAVHARFDGAGCVLTKPMNYATSSALAVGTAIVGTGSPIAWLPA